MVINPNRPAGTVFSSRAIFALAGFAVAAWAPLVPHVKAELNLSHLELSHYILLMGSGSILGMVLIPALLRRLPLKVIFAVAALTVNAALAALVVLPSRGAAAAALLAFGLGLGILEVGGNIYAAFLEDKLKRILLPSMHGCYSAGEIGALVTALTLLGLNCSFYLAILVPAALLTLIALSTLPWVSFNQADFKAQQGGGFSLPKGTVLLLALVSSLIYLVEGGMLDWSALLMLQKTAVDLTFSSSGYIVLITAMAASRFAGGCLIGRFKTYKVLSVSVLSCALTLLTLHFTQSLYGIYACFMILGLALANVMPICITLAGRQQCMPVLAAISAVSTCGYGALIIGPALIGYLAEHLTLSGAFFSLGAAVLALSVLISLKRQSFSLGG